MAKQMHTFPKGMGLAFIKIDLADGADVMMDSIIGRNIDMSDNGLGVVGFCLFAHDYSLINYTLGFECNSIDSDLIFSGR